MNQERRRGSELGEARTTFILSPKPHPSSMWMLSEGRGGCPLGPRRRAVVRIDVVVVLFFAVAGLGIVITKILEVIERVATYLT